MASDPAAVNEAWSRISERIGAAEQRLRDLLSEPAIRQEIEKDVTKLNRAAAALDAMGDTGLALDAFLIHAARDDGEAYLRIYGAFQAVVVQQDAAQILCGAFGEGSMYRRHPDLVAARWARVRIAGHPSETHRDSDGQPSTNAASHQLARYSVQGPHLTIMSNDSAGTCTVDEVDVPEMLRRHAAALADLLEELANTIEEKLRGHKDRCGHVTLAALFPPQLIADVRGAASSGTVPALLVKQVRAAVGSFRGELAKRHQPVDSMSFVRLSVEAAESALRDLGNTNEGSSLRVLEEEIGRLASMAREIDEDYESARRQPS